VKSVSPVRRGVASDAPAVAQRVIEYLARDAVAEPLICADLSRHELEQSLAASPDPWWVDDAPGSLRGHLYGVTLTDPGGTRATWTGPDGVSFDHEDVLDHLLHYADAEWRHQGSFAHHVSVVAGQGTQVWVERDYRVVSVKAVREITSIAEVQWPQHLRLRSATRDDLDSALVFDELIDEAQGDGRDSRSPSDREQRIADVVDLIDDPDNRYFVVEERGRAIAQCVTFQLPALRGSFADTVYLGSLAVDPSWRRRGVARLLVTSALAQAQRDGFGHAEVRWRINNLAATALWPGLGFSPTYVQMSRALR
jgi:ribosomal protein S18 acetylase RimI-like enzyme